MTSYARQLAALTRQLRIAPFRDAIEAAAPDRCDADTWDAVLSEAARVAEGVIDPVDAALDAVGARLVDGRVVAAPGHRAAWTDFAAGGWLGLALPEEVGGQGLPLLLGTACEELFNRASAAFTMLATPGRTAAALLHHAAPDIGAAWIPRLVSGEWAATICISEPDAGSDVGRIRTRARADDAGVWRVTGEKCWISYGDHDLADRIGHCLLARTSDAPGVRGLSLFLVPSTREDGTRNAIELRRIEHKLGLHGSPTCVLGFDAAEAILVGAEGRGLQVLFPMLLQMRLSCAPQGVGVAESALATALDYARERRQGGDPAARAVPIGDHPDVRRQLMRMAGAVEVGRGIALATAAAMDLAAIATPDARPGWLALAQFLLPIAKDRSARLAFDVASGAVQVLGGAGYTREWPVERRLRDARVFAIFEGATGIQALDMLHRQLWRGGGEGLRRFVAIARADIGEGADGAAAIAVLDRLDAAACTMGAWRDSPRDGEAGATAFLDLCAQAVEGWIALRLIRRAGADAVGRRLAAAARFHLAELAPRAELSARLATLGSARLADFEDYAG